MRGLEQGSAAIGALDDDLRQRMYLFIRAQTHPVSRDEAAAAVGISHKLAAFHLDKLVEKGLLSASYAHPVGRPPHRAGRSSKLYEPSEVTVDISIPERRYDLLAEVLAEAVADGGAEAVACAIAGRKGVALGRLAPSSETEPAFTTALRLLGHHGFEPAEECETGSVRLRNCPFHEVARHAPELVCRMNLAFIEGVLEGLEAKGAHATLDPAPGRCCVRLEEAR
jgi:predicted ArsR family transcriptional regulator